MNRVFGVIFMSLATMIGLVSLYIGASLVLSQVVFGGLAILSDILFVFLGGGFIFFVIRWGTSHEKRVLAILFVIGSILFLAFSINMFVGFANSFPSPSKEWVTNMALSRAYTLGEYPVIDDKLITQGRITTSGMGIVALVFSAMLAWVGKNWFRRPSSPYPPYTPKAA